jgi:hypothetical protein
MTTRVARLAAALLGIALLCVPPVVRAEEDLAGRTPPRLSWVDGDASFFRPGAEDWAPAQVNTPLAGGDELYTSHRGNLEIQTGAAEFVRAWGDTQLGLLEADPGRLHVKVTAGHVALDLRDITPQRSLEIGTPHAAFVIGAPGYYRVDVGPERTALAIRRGGRASLTTAGGATVALGAEEQVVIDERGTQRLAAPARDVWDTWNERRTAELVATASARHVPAGVYGAADLDRHGDWRDVADYGAVWVPRAVPTGWAPYSTGRWINDPYYGWTWVDAAPWGWAPYHYGRWVHAGGVWGWAPGPVVVRPVYAPALVAFFGGPAVSVTVGPPCVSWVALGWGEPLVPWWGPARFAGRPWWGGWGGPRVVNNVVVQRTRVVNVNEIHVYRNARVRDAVVAVREDGFGRRAVNEARVRDLDVRRLEPVRGRLGVRPVADSFTGDGRRGSRPPERTVTRQVVSTRPVAVQPVRGDNDRRDGDRRDDDLRNVNRRAPERGDANRRDAERGPDDRRYDRRGLTPRDAQVPAVQPERRDGDRREDDPRNVNRRAPERGDAGRRDADRGPDDRREDRRGGNERDPRDGRVAVPPAASPSPAQPATKPPATTPGAPATPRGTSSDRGLTPRDAPAAGSGEPRPAPPAVQPERPSTQPERRTGQPVRPVPQPDRPSVQPERQLPQPELQGPRAERRAPRAERQARQPERPAVAPSERQAPPAVRPAAQPERQTPRIERPAVQVERPAQPQPPVVRPAPPAIAPQRPALQSQRPAIQAQRPAVQGPPPQVTRPAAAHERGQVRQAPPQIRRESPRAAQPQVQAPGGARRAADHPGRRESAPQGRGHGARSDATR